jgi:hypothetical protein
MVADVIGYCWAWLLACAVAAACRIRVKHTCIAAVRLKLNWSFELESVLFTHRSRHFVLHMAGCVVTEVPAGTCNPVFEQGIELVSHGQGKVLQLDNDYKAAETGNTISFVECQFICGDMCTLQVVCSVFLARAFCLPLFLQFSSVALYVETRSTRSLRDHQVTTTSLHITMSYIRFVCGCEPLHHWTNYKQQQCCLVLVHMHVLWAPAKADL